MLESHLVEIEKRLGRPTEVIQVPSGFIVEYFNFNTSPPPVGKTKEEACSLFLEWFDSLPKEYTDATNA